MPLKLIPQGSGFARLTEAVTSEYGQLIELVRQAVRDKLRLTLNSDYYVDMRGIWPDRTVVQYKGRLYSYAYIVSAENAVVLADAEEVVAQFQPVSDQSGAIFPDISETDRAHGKVKLSDVVRESQDAVAFREAQDGTIEVTLIRSGRSGNRNYYPDEALREAVSMFEGVRVFAKSDADHSAGKGKDGRHRFQYQRYWYMDWRECSQARWL